MMAARVWSLCGEHGWRRNRHDHHKSHARSYPHITGASPRPPLRNDFADPLAVPVILPLSANYGVTAAVKICEFGPLTALPQLSWIFWGECPRAGSREMPIVSPGQTLRWPTWRDTRMGPASHPVWMENGRRYCENRRAERVKIGPPVSHPT